jgi:hypothetical protein
VLIRAAGGRLDADVALVDFSGQTVIGSTRPEWADTP